MNPVQIYPELLSTIQKVERSTVDPARQALLASLIDYIQSKLDEKNAVNLNFICTHNSRRSQFAQIWAKTASVYFGVPVHCFSGGVEVTAFNPRAVSSIRRSGFEVASGKGENPVYSVSFAKHQNPITAFSKLYDDPINNAEKFAAVMTCSEADHNCPFIPGTEKRIPLNYEDPKAYDDSPEEEEKYDERSMQIATELFYVFSNIQN